MSSLPREGESRKAAVKKALGRRGECATLNRLARSGDPGKGVGDCPSAHGAPVRTLAAA